MRLLKYIILCLLPALIASCDEEIGNNTNYEPALEPYGVQLNSNEIRFNTNGGSFGLEIKTEKTWALSMPSDVTWLHLSQNSGTGNATVTVTADFSPLLEERSCTLTVYYNTNTGTKEIKVNVVQSPYEQSLLSNSLPGNTLNLWPGQSESLPLNTSASEIEITVQNVGDELTEAVWLTAEYDAIYHTLKITDLSYDTTSKVALVTLHSQSDALTTTFTVVHTFNEFHKEFTYTFPKEWRSIDYLSNGMSGWKAYSYNDEASDTHTGCVGIENNYPGQFECVLLSPVLQFDSTQLHIALEHDLMNSDPNTALTLMWIPVTDNDLDMTLGSGQEINIDFARREGTSPATGFYTSETDTTLFGRGCIAIRFSKWTSDSSDIKYYLRSIKISAATDVPDDLGSEERPYTVAEVKASTTDATDVWVEGYVVGYVKGKTWEGGVTFSGSTEGVSIDDYNNTNCILADSPSANSIAQAIPVSIPSGWLRDLFGLRANPAVYGEHVKLRCDITKYFGIRGVKNISEYILI